MPQYKITAILARLDKKQMSRLGDFIRSPYYNSQQPVTDLFEYLEKHHPKFTDENLRTAVVLKQ